MSIATVTTPHPEYAKAVPRWQLLRDVFEGEDAIKAAGTTYTPRLSDQTDAEYTAYVNRPSFFGAFERTVQGLTGVGFMKEPGIEVHEKVAPHLTDITLSAVPFLSLARKVTQEVLTVGRVGLLLDYSTAAARPYWLPYLAEQIINWDTVSQEGRTVLTFLVLRECIEAREGFAVVSRVQYRVFELIDGACVVTVWTEQKTGDKVDYVAGPPVRLQRRGQPMPRIPFVFLSPFGVDQGISKAPLMSLAKVNLAHWRASVDLEHGRHWTSLPTPLFSGCDEPTGGIRLGSSRAIWLPAAGAEGKYLEFSGQGLGSLERSLAEKERQMEVIGARMLEKQKSAVESGKSIEQRHTGDSAVLETIIGSVSLGLSIAMRLHAWWLGVTEDISDPAIAVTLNTDFVDANTIDVNALSLLAQAGRISQATLYYNLERAKLTRPGVDVDAEREQILAEGNEDPGASAPPASDATRDPSADGSNGGPGDTGAV